MVPILTYHSMHVSGNDYDDNDHVALGDDLASIGALGLRVCSLSDVVEALEADDLHELAGCVAITFDDGPDFDFRDLPHPAWGMQRSMFNILRDHADTGTGARATSFAIVSPHAREELDRTCMIGTRWWNDDWWADADRSGILRVESHSWDHNHESLAATASSARAGTFDVRTLEDADAEIRAATAYLCERRGRKAPVMFAYPYGEASDYLVREYLPRGTSFHGVRAAFTTDGAPVSRAASRWLLPRFVFRHHWKTPGELERILRDASARAHGGVSLVEDLAEVEEMARVAPPLEALFKRSFGAPPPADPRHFGIRLRTMGTRPCGYVHYTEIEPGVFLLGGLCIDRSVYRDLGSNERRAIAGKGSLSRILLDRSIANLGAKRAVFAYTGHTMSRRDTTALGFLAVGRYLMVQWHGEPPGARQALLEKVRAMGAF